MSNRNNILFFVTVIVSALSFTSCESNKTDLSPDSTETKVEELSAELVSVPSESLTLADFIKWCADEKNQLNKTKTVSDINYNLTFLPNEAMAALELRREEMNSTNFSEALSHYADMTYFKLKIESPNYAGELLKYKLLSPQQYDSRVKYLSFDMQKDICLIQGSDTLVPGLYQFERAFEATPFVTVMMGFDNRKFSKEKEFTVCYSDKLFEKGFIKYNYLNGQLVNLPKITKL